MSMTPSQCFKSNANGFFIEKTATSRYLRVRRGSRLEAVEVPKKFKVRAYFTKIGNKRYIVSYFNISGKRQWCWGNIRRGRVATNIKESHQIVEDIISGLDWYVQPKYANRVRKLTVNNDTVICGKKSR